MCRRIQGVMGAFVVPADATGSAPLLGTCFNNSEPR
jgi:hypothetical protein